MSFRLALSALRETDRKDGAAGVDGVTAEDYDAKLEVNLTDLLARIQSGRYVAPPVRRALHAEGVRHAATFGHLDAGKTRWRSGRSCYCWSRSTRRGTRTPIGALTSDDVWLNGANMRSCLTLRPIERRFRAMPHERS